MTDWAKIYRDLGSAGYSDEEIARTAEVSRSVINKVRNGTYPFNHEPRHQGGVDVLALHKAAKDGGFIPEDNQ